MIENHSTRTWTADNGNGTFTNPLFYDEFSDPDLIRVGDDFYLTGTTNHTFPGLPVLHSKDLVNWTFLSYAFDRLDLGPEFRLEDGEEIYGQGIWAPCFRYHNGTFHIFSNVNGHTTQLFRAINPAGPWTRTAMKCVLHDLSVLFDDDGKIYVVWGYQGLQFAQLNDDLTDLIPGTQQPLLLKDKGLGEGAHFYKIDGQYFLTSAWFEGRMRMPCARSDRPEGPYEINQAVSMDEDFGLAEGYRMWESRERPFDVVPQNTLDGGRNSLHQGGIVDTPTGEWWGFSMMDANSVGRLTGLSPVTWQDGWPYFGLLGNLKRTPRTWTKPNTGHTALPHAPYERSDDFSTPQLKAIWQWNHTPDDSKWSLSERPGFLRLHSLPATDLWWARNTLTQRSIGPVSIPTVELDASGLQVGDVAGLALLNLPYAWLGVRYDEQGLTIEQFEQRTGETTHTSLNGTRVWLRAHCDFLREEGQFFYSINGEHFEPFGAPLALIFQTKTFQGVRYSLFHFNTQGVSGGYADFDGIDVHEPHPHGLMKPIPYGQTITLSPFGDDLFLVVKEGSLRATSSADALVEGAAAQFQVVDCGLGRVALQAAGGYVSVSESGEATRIEPIVKPGETETFQWTETLYGDLILLSLVTHRHLRVERKSGAIFADHPGPKPDRKDGSCFCWNLAGAK
ncbi:non-reducing end alpha-L-arabinofuranosidase BoGH43B [Abditibacteriota bacterium]|nr:non-reducing end alpha-L-arabinofuranosidase BoGH43B [Abditibacteriota bacterium]